MRTPMQEHIEWMQEKLRILVEYKDLDAGAEVDECIQHAEQMLKKEKEVIKNAYIEGCGDNILCESTDKKRAEEYYNETFNTNQENLQDSTNGYTYYPQEYKTVFNTKEK